jgi:hypothetical protein
MLKYDGASWALTDPNHKYRSNSIVVNVTKKIHNHLRFYDHAIASKNSIEYKLDLLKLQELTAVKGDAFTIFLNSSVLKDKQALVFLQMRYERACSFEKNLNDAEEYNRE